MDGPRLTSSSLVAALSVALACSVAGPPSTDTTPSAALEPDRIALDLLDRLDLEDGRASVLVAGASS